MNENSNANNVGKCCKRRSEQNFNSIGNSFETLGFSRKITNHVEIAVEWEGKTTTLLGEW